jgi:hypothetical protein
VIDILAASAEVLGEVGFLTNPISIGGRQALRPVKEALWVAAAHDGRSDS